MAAYSEGLNILHKADVGLGEQEHDAETTPLEHPEWYRYSLDLGEISEVWRRGSVIQSWLLDLTAQAFVEDPELSRVLRPGLRLRRGSLDHPGGHRRGRARARPHHVAVRAVRQSRRGDLRRQDHLGDAQAVRRPRREEGLSRWSTRRVPAKRAARSGRRSRSHVRGLEQTDTCASCSTGTRTGAYACPARAPAGSPTGASSGSPTRRCGCCSSSPSRSTCRGASTRCSRGERINVTENRPVLHVALRAPTGTCRSSWTAMTSCPTSTRCSTGCRAFADQVRDGTWRGHTGKPVTAVVNIGIGGSDLGPVMASAGAGALRPPGHPRCGSCPTSTAPTSPRRPSTSIRRRRCSSSPRRRSPPSRR